jgi:hypothetical protein
MWEDIFTIISNLAFLIPFSLAVHYGYVLTAFDLMAQMLFSMAYHSCNSYSSACLGLSPMFWRHGDFFWAQYLIMRTALNLIHFRNRWVRPSLMIAGGTLIFLLQAWIGESMWLQFIIAFISLGGLLLYWGVYAFQRYMENPDRPWSELFPPYRWLYVAMGFALSGLACSLYVTEMLDHKLYWAIHSVWHMDAALGQFFVLLAWPPGIALHNQQEQAFLAKLIQKREDAPFLMVPVVAPHRRGLLHHRTPPSKF